MTTPSTYTAIDQLLFNTIVTLGNKSGKAYVILNTSLTIIYQNNAHESLSGFSFDLINNQHFSTIIGNSKSQNHFKQLEKAMLAGELSEMNIVHKKKQGLAFSSQLNSIPFQTENGQTRFVLLFIKDVTNEKIEQSLLRLEQNIIQTIDQGIRFQQKIEQICYEINFIFEPHCFTTIAWANQEELYLFADTQKEGQISQALPINDTRYPYYSELIHANSFKILNSLSDLPLDENHKAFAKEHQFDFAFTMPITLSNEEQKGAIILYLDDFTRDTSPFESFFVKLIGLIEFAYNYERQKDEMYNLAYYDPTLNIPNRHGMTHYLKQHKQELESKNLSVVLLSPSEYIKIAELYGRDAGELMLKEIMQRIRTCIDYDIILIGRFSSSTLYVVVAGEIDPATLDKSLNYKMTEPMRLQDRTIYLTVKSGIATQQVGICIEETSRRAEIALAQARKVNGNSLGMYDEQYTQQIEKELMLLNHLTAAINKQEIQVYFQPKIELHRGRVDSMEALARWISPTLGFISPAEFIPVAEKNGLIRKIDLLIIEQVLKWMQQRLYSGEIIVPVAVNISAEHFYHPKFIDHLMALTQQYHADPKYIIIEVTETLGLEDSERAHQIINRLNIFGFTVSVDDFGIGYSSLSYLQKLNFSELKIDMSFVKRLDEEGTRAIVRSIIDIAKHLEMRVTAEGVETEEQAKLLKTLGCDVAQGYLYFKPMPIDALDF